MDDKVEKAKKALVEEEKEIVKEDHAEKVVEVEKKKIEKKEEKEEAKHPQAHYETVPDKDVEIRSAELKHEVAGNYRKSKNLMIHDHPVWIKVQPTENRMGYYQEKHWHITDLKNLHDMLAEQKADA